MRLFLDTSVLLAACGSLSVVVKCFRLLDVVSKPSNP